jgi:RNA-binding protein
MKKLSSKQIKFLRGRAHHLNPVVMTGQHGVTDAVIREIEATLNHHELIKVKIRCEGQSELLDLLRRITEYVQAVLVQVIGHTAVFYRRSIEHKIQLPV